jgi:hypothetical protein
MDEGIKHNGSQLVNFLLAIRGAAQNPIAHDGIWREEQCHSIRDVDN